VDADDIERLREFLERWGLLGVGVPVVFRPSLADLIRVHPERGKALRGADDVAATRMCLRELQRLAHGTDPDALASFWHELEGTIVCDVSVTVTRTGLELSSAPSRLLDVIVLALPLWAAMRE
jgi:hypothetical protein